MIRSAIQTGIVGSALFASSFAQALAQQADAPQGGDQEVASSGGLEDIVVTANRRQENMQRVPVTISTLSGEKFEQFGIKGIDDLASAVTGLVMNRQIGASTPYMRGVGAFSAVVGQDSPIATYVDGVYIPGMNGTIMSMNNVERVEVLKGPQGTLFGRNATGGLINIITKTPDQTLHVDAKVGYGNYDTRDGSFYISGGLTDRVTANFAAYYHDQKDGPGVNLARPGDEGPVDRTYSLAGKIRYAIDSETTLTVSGDYTNMSSNYGIWRALLPGARGLDGSTHQGGYYDINSNLPVNVKIKTGGFAATFEHDFGDVSFKSISAFRTNKTHQVYDQEATPSRIVDVNFLDPTDKTFTQEVQVLSNDSGPFTWIVGAFYMYTKGDLQANITGAGVGAAQFQNIDGYQKTNSYAAYSQGTYELGTGTRITAGLRYTLDERAINSSVTTALNRVSRIDTKSYKKLTYRAVIDQQITDQVMAFASFNRGFKSGAFNVSAPAQAPVNPEILDAAEIGIKSDLFDRRVRLNVSAYHYWYRNIQLSQLLPGQTAPTLFNAAKAKMKGFDAELTVVPVDGLTLTGNYSYLDGKYTEFPGGFVSVPRPTPAGGNSFVTADLAGNHTIRSPKHTASISASYKMDTSFGALEFSASNTYNSGFYWEPANRLREDSYNLVNGDVTARFGQDKQYHLRGWVKNALSSNYSVYTVESGVGDIYAPAMPATYGVDFGVRF